MAKNDSAAKQTTPDQGKKSIKTPFAKAKSTSDKKGVTISVRDQKVLIIVAAIGLFLGIYFLSFSPKISETQEIEAECESLKTRITELQARAAQAEGLKVETAQLRGSMEEKLKEFPSQVNPEDVIFFLNKLEEEEKNELTISSESFGEPEVFYQTTASAASANTETEPAPAETEDVAAVLDNATENGSADGTIYYKAPVYGTGNEVSQETELSDEESSDAMKQLEEAEEKMSEEEDLDQQGDLNTDGPYTGYMIASTISIETTYDGLKHIIDMINKHEDKVRIQTISAAFDNTTGTISGSMSLSFYAIGGNGKEYEAPKIKGIPLGLDNIFGTVTKSARDDD